MESKEIQGSELTQGEAAVNGTISSEVVSNNLDDSIGLSQQKLRNAQVEELTFS
ncbi:MULTISPECIES: hypothetical protein [Desulfosporosinus]|uniref:Uncharacterized protein n=1 Tax=Desulfosporosinus hippei DSM 8344 TaxID=1121419 RepID=A0A1G7X784_9FIRM|nr:MULTISPECIES: hypothetical protein [Desulfosporosinus]SDG80003.1 hypothetical protein SAMN05443529_106148 [Desulfosporosinus hippei DSM 8344]